MVLFLIFLEVFLPNKHEGPHLETKLWAIYLGPLLPTALRIEHTPNPIKKFSIIYTMMEFKQSHKLFQIISVDVKKLKFQR